MIASRVKSPVRSVRLLRVAAMPGGRGCGRLCCGAIVIPCTLGVGGITRCKREGDGATPAGRFKLLKSLFRPDKDLRPWHLPAPASLRPNDGWCDDPTDRRYNRQVKLPIPPRHEKLWRTDSLYNIVIVLNYNHVPCVKGRGSAIFFHIARPDRSPTAGCVAITSADMRRLLPRLSAYTVMVVG
jgi:L,D-peptidoglycan transpeptidase YkuD (ErfK/YbiS/YcfS/YnhG family)